MDGALGHGGMGIVYRAHHKRTGKRVALKTVKMIDERQLNGIRREIHALSRIRHPGIVGIVDQGVHEGIPWYAMEILDGVSLRKRATKLQSMDLTSTTLFHTMAEINTDDVAQTLVLDELPLTDEEIAVTEDGPPVIRPPAAMGNLAEVLTLVCRLCAPLAFLHGEGIIHRDLKPDNVLILEGNRPVLFDFGLMSRISTKGGRATLTVDGLLLGTVAYMAPEQIRGELVDARADLYALGCILYELVTGRLPYRSPSASAMLYQHLERIPLPPSERVSEVPLALDHLILKLLEKRPEERMGYADDVATALRALGASPSDEPLPTPRAYLYRPRFAGRQKALTLLHQELGPFGGGVVFIGGESGVGKTRLALEFAREATGRGFAVLAAECELFDTANRGVHGGAFYPFRKPLQAVVDRCLHQGPDESQRIVGRRGPVLARFEPSLLALHGQSEQPEPAVLEHEAEELRAIRYLTELFVEYASDHRLLLLIDDLQWADDLTLKWLTQLQRNCPQELVVVGIYRIDETEARIEALLANAKTCIQLRRMGREAVGNMVGDMLALHPPPPDLVDFLAEHSEGNPFFVAEYLRMAVTEGILERQSNGQWQIAGSGEAPFRDMPLPGPLRSLVSRRLVGLSAPAREIAEIASVFGREVDPNLLQKIQGHEDGVWLAAVAELIERQVMEDAKGLLRFVHDKVREVAYDQIDAERRATLHGHAATAIEAVLAGDLVGRMAELGNHWHKAGDLDKAAERYLATARRAASQYAHEDSERFYRIYLGLFTAPTPEFIRARNELAHQVLMPRGKHDETMIELQHALREARSLGDVEGEAQSLENLGGVTRTVGRLQDAVDLFKQALAIRREQDEPRGLGRVLCLIGFGYAGIGDLEQSRVAFAEAFDLAVETRDTWIEARALMGLARIDKERNNKYIAEESVKQALKAFRALGDRTGEARALNQLANIYSDNGEDARAFKEYGRALAVNREIGDRIGEGIVQANKAILLHKLGRSSESHKVYAEALQIFREIGHHRYQGHAMFCIARHFHTEGRLAEAKGLSKNALTLLAVVGDHKWSAEVHVALSRIALEEDDLEVAGHHGGRALAIAEDLSLPTHAAGALCTLGQIAVSTDDLAQAEALHQRQRAAAEEIGAELTAVADVHLGRVARLAGDVDTAEETLRAALDALAVDNTADRAMAHIELGWIAVARGGEVQEALRAATAAHHTAVYLNRTVAKAISELEASRG